MPDPVLNKMETQIMRTLVLAAALAGAVSLAACSDSGEDAAETGADATASAAPVDVAPTADADAVLDANSATAEQLAAAGLSAEAASSTLANVFVPVNLNTATREEIKLIPGMTDRMVGEFLEYRPYEDMAEFDREIGKYVDEAEVARFRRYVTL